MDFSRANSHHISKRNNCRSGIYTKGENTDIVLLEEMVTEAATYCEKDYLMNELLKNLLRESENCIFGHKQNSNDIVLNEIEMNMKGLKRKAYHQLAVGKITLKEKKKESKDLYSLMED